MADIKKTAANLSLNLDFQYLFLSGIVLNLSLLDYALILICEVHLFRHFTGLQPKNGLEPLVYIT